jgi:hypothetical protein
LISWLQRTRFLVLKTQSGAKLELWPLLFLLKEREKGRKVVEVETLVVLNPNFSENCLRNSWNTMHPLHKDLKTNGHLTFDMYFLIFFYYIQGWETRLGLKPIPYLGIKFLLTKKTWLVLMMPNSQLSENKKTQFSTLVWKKW